MKATQPGNEPRPLFSSNTDGDSDSINAITGSVIGARLGLNAIPLKWRDGVEDSDYLHALGKRLWQKRGPRFP
jgi:ADP-ribosylglycohydrolase